MISEAEVRRAAARLGVDPMVVDLDYVLGCFLASLYRQPLAAALRFKGGTCLRKCYYGNYRFSEDLDFTLTSGSSRADLEKMLGAVLAAAADEWEIDFGVRPLRVDVVDDEYGNESFQARLYYRGPLRRSGDPRAIRLDITTSEVLTFPAAERGIIHLYSDAALLAGILVPCYDILEMLAEKIRALAGQRRYAISRDIYDIAQLTSRAGVDMARLAAAIPAKWRIKGLRESDFDPGRIAARRGEFQADWERNLVHLLPSDGIMDFDSAWDRTCVFLKAANWPRGKIK